MNLRLFEIIADIKPGKNSPILNKCTGAIVSCYVSAYTHILALENAIHQLKADHYIFHNLVCDIREINVGVWDDYIQSEWEGWVDHFPNSIEVAERMRKHIIFYSPFSLYND